MCTHYFSYYAMWTHYKRCVILYKGDLMPISEKQKLQSYKYKAANIKRVPLDMQVTDYNLVKAAAASAGESVNGYIKLAIRERMERDNGGERDE